MVNKKQLQDIANILRRDVLEMTTAAGSGHPTSCMSSAEIMSVLFFNEMRFDKNNAFNPDNDEFILSKGHAAPILYASLYRAGCLSHHPSSLRKLKSPLEGHPVPSSHTPWIKVATGSLGQGLSIGTGFALAAKMQKRKFHTYVLLGDSESAEGSVFEAFELASHYKLDNLIAIIDVNRLGQTGETMLGHNINVYKSRFQSFGWNTITINGHDISELVNAFNKAKSSPKPTLIIAKTFKGKGVSFLENKNGWHGKALTPEQLQQALKEIPNPKMPKISIKKPSKTTFKFKKIKPKITKYDLNEQIATREAYGKALANLALSNQRVIAIDGEVSNSTHSEKVKEKTPKQFIEAYIAEQNMIGMSLELSKKGFNVFASSFAAFLSRAHDQIRMASLSSPNFTISGSHAGISIGEDGASQMGLEDIAIFRALPDSIVLYPSDAVSAEKLTYLASKIPGLKYIRTTRPKTPVIYKNNESFKIGVFKILKQSTSDKATLIGSGITLHEALKAHNQLKQQGINTAVIDLYCIKPLNTNKLIDFIKKHGNKTIITEDHYKEGGIGETLCSQLKNTNIKLKHLCVNQIPHSGTKDELLDKYKISAKHIVNSLKDFK